MCLSQIPKTDKTDSHFDGELLHPFFPSFLPFLPFFQNVANESDCAYHAMPRSAGGALRSISSTQFIHSFTHTVRVS